MQGIFQKENTDKALKYGIYRHLPTYEKIIRNLVSFSVKDYEGNIKISWPEGLIPDSTQAVFEDVKTRPEDLYEAGELTLWMEPYTSRTFRFFKTDAETDYTWDTKLNAEAAD